MTVQAINIFDELAEFLASMDPERVLKFHAWPAAQKRMDSRLFKNKEAGLTSEAKN